MPVFRFCAALIAIAALAGAVTKAAVFGNGRAYFHRTLVAPYRFRDTILHLHFDVARGIVYGDESVQVRPKSAGLRALPFNAVGIHFERVTVNGRLAAYTLDASRQGIAVHLGSPAAAGAVLNVGFRYWAQPQSGIYFVRPDKAYPHIAPEIWSQGEPTDNRRWFPTWDEPNEKTPSELVVTVPRGWTVVANGYLKAHRRTASGEIWDWDSPKPTSTYLISFAAGPLSKNHTSLGALDVDSYVQPQYAGLNALCFARTKDMIAYFQRIIGVAYPWEKYDQTTAERYVFGGMEDTSATLLTTHALHPPSEEPENSCDPLVSHELAQQWWGDDATMSDWANAWLHEGFATYFDELWSGRSLGPDEFEYARYQAQQLYFQETRRYLRPIVDYVYADPLDVFDASSHERPAEILHMLRCMFGDARFFAATRDYLRQFAFKNADTDAFFSVIQRSLHTDLGWFKAEWFYRPDYPNYYVRDRYDKAAHTIVLDVRQRNIQGKPFRMPIVLEAFFGRNVARIETVIARNHQTVTMHGITSAPQMVLFDPNGNVLKQLTFAKSPNELAYQLANARHVGDREWALAQLAPLASSARAARTIAAAAVRKAATLDRFYGIRADAMGAAAGFDDANAIERGLRDPDKRVRLAAEAAAAQLRGKTRDVIARLKVLSRDGDPNVAAAALRALGALRAPHAYALLVQSVSRPSFAQTVASGALNGLASYGDARALPLLASLTAYGTPEQERAAAILALARLARATNQIHRIFPLLEHLSTSDPLIRTRIAATGALGTIGSRAALAVLKRIEASDSQLLVRDSAADARMVIEAASQKQR